MISLALTVALLPPVLLATMEEAHAAVLPSGLVEETAVQGLDAPVTFEFADDGRLFVAEQGGKVKVFSSLQASSPDVVADLSPAVRHFWDRGMLGMALDPDFPSTPHIYVLYTYDYNPNSEAHAVPSSWGDGCSTPPGATDDGCVVMGRLSRLVVDGSTATQEDVLIEDSVPAVSKPLDRLAGFRPGRRAVRERGRGRQLQLRRLWSEGGPAQSVR